MVGSYVGNGNADGTFVYTGFRPAMIIYKKSSASGNDWFILDNKRDTYNIVGQALYPNTNDAEANDNIVDFLSNGFKMRNTYASSNDSNATYLLLAFAESPFKTANAR